MKAIFITVAIVLSFVCTYAQTPTNLFLDTGYVGIGTRAPAAPLHIAKGQQNLQFGTGVCTSGYTLSVGVNDDGVNFSTNTPIRGFNFKNFNGSLLTVSAGGNVGVGTVPSNMRLEVNGIIRSTAPVVFFGPGTATDVSTTLKRGLYVDNGVSSAWELLTLQNANGVQLKVTGDGNVGIGTLNPKNYKLAVEGTIGARRVKVTQESWADFVFHPDYQLPALPDVAGYIEKNAHLPGIPTEKEVKENGVDLGEMNKLLLQRIEEQMLYIIQLNKQVQELSQQVKRLGK